MKPAAAPEDAACTNGSFESIFLTHYQRVLSLLSRLVGERMHAEELSNEVFCRLYAQPANAAVWSSPASWLYRTATNLGIDAIRASARRRHYEEAAGLHWQTFSQPEPGPLDSVLRRERSHQVRAVLSSMKLPQAQLLLLRACGCQYKDLADALGVAPGSVGTLLNRAEAEFRKRYIKLTGQKEAI